MKKGSSNIGNVRTYNNLKIDSLLRNNYNHSNYYRFKNYKYAPNSRKTNNSSIMNQYNKSYNNSNIIINSTTNILNNLRNTIQNSEKVLNNNRKYLKNEILENIKLSKSVNLKENKKRSKKKKKKKKEKSFENESNSYKIKEENEKINNKKLEELNNIRSKLLESNIELRKLNKILETEINNYKRQIYSRKNHSNMSNYMPIMNNNFLKNKSSLQASLSENSKCLEKILKLSEINMDLYNQIKNDSSSNKQLFKKVENFNRENAEIQILNEENENKFKNLNDIKTELLNKKEKLNLILQNLKNSGKNYSMLHEFNFKKLKEEEELMKQLKSAKNLFEEELNKRTEKMNFNTQIIYQNNRRLVLYNNKINNLADDISNLKFEKNRLIQKRSQINNQLLDYVTNE